jgi:hypothetical protein
MLAALVKTMGVVTYAAKAAKIDPSTHYEWLAKDKEYADSVHKLKDIPLDFAESSLHKLIRKGNVAASIFYLKCRGKQRGYVEQSLPAQVVDLVIHVKLPDALKPDGQ